MFNLGPKCADNVALSDTWHATQMKAGSDLLLDRIRLARGELIGNVSQGEFRWDHRLSMGVKPDPDAKWTKFRHEQYQAVQTTESAKMANAQWVDRDPCWRCGVRSDVGCGCK